MDPSRQDFSPGGPVPAGAVLLGVVALLVVAAIVLLTVSRAGSGSGDARPAPPVADDRVPARPEPSVTTGAVRSVLLAYVRAYDAEDAQAAGATMSADVVRRSGTDAAQYGRRDATAEYQRQFDELVAPRYLLDRLSIATGARDARAYARYTITSDAAPGSAGAIAFHLVRVGSRLLIDGITAVPD
jgi:hypothetical protein